MKKLHLLLALLVIGAGLGVYFAKGGLTKVKAYYSGDAISFNGRTLIITTNMGNLETFSQDGTSLKKLGSLKPANSGFDTFNHAVFSTENDNLFVYAASGATLYKFNANNPANLILVTSAKDNSWDWFGRIDKLQGKLVTIGSKGVKIWNQDLQVIDRYNVVNTTNPYNVRLSNDGRFIFNIHGDRLDIFDRQTRSNLRTIYLSTNTITGNRQMHFDESQDMIYVIDDGALKRFSLDGSLRQSLKHDSKFGYDTVASTDGASIYITNGTSIAKIRKTDFAFLAGFENRAAKLPESWAMGAKVFATNQGEKIVTFNNGTIVVLSNNLKLLASAKSTTEAVEKIEPKDALKLTADRYQAIPLSMISLSGQGYWANETLTISFADRVYTGKADANGKFTKNLYVPNVAANRVDIKVVGQSSGLSYSTSFIIIHADKK